MSHRFKPGDRIYPNPKEHREDTGLFGVVVKCLPMHQYEVRWDKFKEQTNIWPEKELEIVSILNDCFLIRLV